MVEGRQDGSYVWGKLLEDSWRDTIQASSLVGVEDGQQLLCYLVCYCEAGHGMLAVCTVLHRVLPLES